MATDSSTVDIDGIDIQITNHTDATDDVTRTVVVRQWPGTSHRMRPSSWKAPGAQP